MRCHWALIPLNDGICEREHVYILNGSEDSRC